MTDRRPVGEGCHDNPQPPVESRAQALGIINIHKACEPPCGRKRAAQRFLGIAQATPGRTA